MKTIMGQDVDKLITITGDTDSGRTSFWMLVVILLAAFAVYEVMYLLWAKAKISKLEGYRQYIAQKIGQPKKKQRTEETNAQDDNHNQVSRNNNLRPVRRDIKQEPAVINAMKELQDIRRIR